MIRRIQFDSFYHSPVMMSIGGGGGVLEGLWSKRNSLLLLLLLFRRLLGKVNCFRSQLGKFVEFCPFLRLTRDLQGHTHTLCIEMLTEK